MPGARTAAVVAMAPAAALAAAALGRVGGSAAGKPWTGSRPDGPTAMAALFRGKEYLFGRRFRFMTWVG